MADETTDWHAQETYKSMMEYGRGMLRFGLITNGGAILAILTFLGDLNAKGGAVPSMGLPLFIFVGGVILAGVAGISAYFVQLNLFGETLHGNDPKGWSGHMKPLKLTLVLVLGSLLSFAGGSVVAVCRLQ